ncbi:phosphate ABC transporter substrate-binding protein [Roseibacillus ishigakijimensis]|uniref:Phosphate ABC transporter substrate-binding protein n=1 Tax=Roseibacillus ishigakijimensis TaxID=454146 RepID=A0A934RND5_9BACT|nr:phosphate ABC transporter substrate-binding protein [Roseibacillus ishigakijimensis]MBK1833980.1 phosphate ABC transporter substrate-binding protein [Roseibacillus ishigakijimensis]
MKVKTLIATLASGLILGGTALGQSKVVIKGSDTLGAKMVPQLTAVYKAKGNAVDFEIAAEGSSTAFTSLLEGTADIGMSSRDAKEGEKDSFTAKGKELVEHVAGIDMIAVVVNEANSVKNLTKKQVEGIFTGEITDWSELGGKKGAISVYTRNTSSGTYKSFQELAMNKRDYGSSTQKMAGNEAIASEVGRNPNGIGYVGLAYAENEGLVPVTVDGKGLEKPSEYPLSRKLYYYTVGEPSGETAKFLEWAMTDEIAKKVIEKVGFVAAE